MNIAIIQDGACVNVAVFESLSTAQLFLQDGVWQGAEDVAELPEGYGIGDFYDGSTWEKAPVLAPPEPPNPPKPPVSENRAKIDGFVMGMMEEWESQNG